MSLNKIIIKGKLKGKGLDEFWLAAALSLNKIIIKEKLKGKGLDEFWFAVALSRSKQYLFSKFKNVIINFVIVILFRRGFVFVAVGILFVE